MDLYLQPSLKLLLKRKANPNPDLLTWTEDDQRAVILLQSSLTEEAALRFLVSLLLTKYGYLLKLRIAMRLLERFYLSRSLRTTKKVHLSVFPDYLVVDSKALVTSFLQSVTPC
ncbi:hypothetical protein Tco_0731666 [Tanacetum coccineum]